MKRRQIELDDSKSSGMLHILLKPIFVYVFYLLFNNPAGWLMINLLVPIKAMSEYTEIHTRMLKYVLKRDDKPIEPKYEKLFQNLIVALNGKGQSQFALILFHLALMTFSAGNIGFVLVTLYVGVFVQKLTKFHYFMTYPSKENEKLVAEKSV